MTAEEFATLLRWDAAGDAALAALDAPAWEAALATAQAGNAEALFARRLARQPGLAIPAFVAEALAQARIEIAARALASSAALAPALIDAGVPVLLLKGADIGRRIYGDLGSRAMGDIDLLVAPEHLGRVGAALAAHGFRPGAAERSAQHHLIFAPPTSAGLPVELHWALSSDGGDSAALRAELWSRAEPADLFGADVRVLERHDLLLYLCFHLRHHLFEVPLTHLWDLAELIAWAGADFDWAEFWRRCDRHGMTRGAALALHLAGTTLGVPVPPAALPADVLAALPAVAANLGRHPRPPRRTPGPNFSRFFHAGTPWRSRAEILRTIAFPPLATLGTAAQRAPTLGTRIAVWRRLLRVHLPKLAAFARGDARLRGEAHRTATLRAWLHGAATIEQHD